MEARARIEELTSEGVSPRKIAARLADEGLGELSHVTVYNYQKARRAAQEAAGEAGEASDAPVTPGGYRGRGRPRKGAGGPPAAGAVGGVAALPDEPVPKDAPADLVRQRLGAVRAVLRDTEQAVRDGRFPATQWATLVRTETDLVERLAEIERHVPKRPEDDPANLALGEQLRNDILGRIEDAERRRGTLCARCMHEIDRRPGGLVR